MDVWERNVLDGKAERRGQMGWMKRRLLIHDYR